MKKIICILVLAVGIFSCTSCTNDCICKIYFNGELKSEEQFEKEDHELCTDYDATIDILGQEAKRECFMDLDFL